MSQHLLTYFLAIVLGLIPAFIAQKKGRNFFLWWAFGAGVLILALPAALILKPVYRNEPTGRAYTAHEPQPAADQDDRRPCPNCAESIKREARFCRFCQLEVARA